MQVYDVFYQIITELTPKEVGRFVRTHRQANEYGLISLEKYLRTCFRSVLTPKSTVNDLKILHMKILRIESLTVIPNSCSYSKEDTLRIMFDPLKCDYNSIKDVVSCNAGDLSLAILQINPLKLVNRDIDLISSQVLSSSMIIYYVMLYYCKGDIVQVIMNLTMSNEPQFTDDKIFEILFKDLGVKQHERFIKDNIFDIYMKYIVSQTLNWTK